MNWKKIIAIIAGILLIAAFVYKLNSNKETATERVYHFDKEAPVHVQTQILELEEIQSELLYSGAFEANRESKISAETQGKVNHIYIEVGDFVSKGQKLLQLDNAILQQQLNLINVQSQNAKIEYDVQLNANQIQIDGIKKDLARYSILIQSDAIQGVQLEKAEMQLQTAENQRRAILQQSGLKSLNAQKQSIEEQINKTTIRAPFSGVVTMKFTELGAFAAPGVPLIQLTDIALLKFTINVSENEINQFQLGKTYHVFADIYKDQDLESKVSLIGSKANPGGSYPIQFTLKNLEKSKIKSGMFGKVEGKSGAGVKGFLIPSSAVSVKDEQAQVYLIQEGKAVLQNITISHKIQNKSAVTNGLADGDKIITNGLINVFEGANVTIN